MKNSVVNKFKNIVNNYDLLPLLLFLVTSSLFFIISFVNIDQPILGVHDFRRSQTALTAFYMIKEGFKFDYITPVVGYPWSIPFEFPIYQVIVSLLCNIFDSSLIITGRVVSILFAYFCTFPIYLSLNILNFRRRDIYYLISIFLASPIYIFWSSTFMIESCALFFTLFFIFYAIKIFMGKNNILIFFNFSLFLLLALLQKATTALPVLFIVCLVYLMKIDFKNLGNKFSNHIKFFFSILFPLVFLYCWTMYTDQLKSLNPIGLFFTSYNLKGWVWGANAIFESRLSSQLWINALIGTIKQNSFLYLSFISIIFSLFISKGNHRKIIVVSLILFISHFLFFPILHRVHNYYQYSNYIYFVVAFVISLIIISEYFIKKFRIKLFKVATIQTFIFIVLVVILFIKFFDSSYAKAKFKKITDDNNRVIPVSNFIKKNTKEEDVIIVYGFEYSSVIAFHSERKALTLPYGKWDIDAINNTRKYLHDLRLGAIINCYYDNHPNKKLIDELIINKYHEKPYSVKNCKIYLIKN